jgi:hypothetical protein
MRLSWCETDNQPKGYFYGNFVAYRTSFMRSELALKLSRYLYYHEGQGYFRYRWGDQAFPPAILCHALHESEAVNSTWAPDESDRVFDSDIPKIFSEWHREQHVRHLKGLRDIVFVHKKNRHDQLSSNTFLQKTKG